MARGLKGIAAVVVAWLSVVGCGDTDVVTPFGEETTTGMPPSTPVSATTTGIEPTGSEQSGGQDDDSSSGDDDGGQSDPCTSHEDCID